MIKALIDSKTCLSPSDFIGCRNNAFWAFNIFVASNWTFIAVVLLRCSKLEVNVLRGSEIKRCSGKTVMWAILSVLIHIEEVVEPCNVDRCHVWILYACKWKDTKWGFPALSLPTQLTHLKTIAMADHLQSTHTLIKSMKVRDTRSTLQVYQKVDSYGASTSSKFRIEGAGQLQFFGTPRYIIAIIFKSQTIGSSDRFRIIQIRCSGAGLPYNSALFISQPIVLTIWSTTWSCSRLFPQTIWAKDTERFMLCTMLNFILQVLWFFES